MTTHEEEVLGKAYDARLMKRLLSFLQPYKWTAVVALLLLLMSTAADLTWPFLIKTAVDRHIAVGRYQGLPLLAALFVLALVVKAAAEYGYGVKTAVLGQKIMHDLRSRLFDHILRLPLSFFDKNPVGRLVTRVTNDVETLNEMLSAGIVAVIGDVAVLTGIIAIMFALHWKLAMVTFLVLPIPFAATEIFRRKARDAYREIRLRLARINSFLQENITGMATVQLFNREAKNLAQFVDLNDRLRLAHRRSIFYHGLYFSVVGVTVFLSTALILNYGGGQVWRGTISIGVLVAFTQYVRRFFQPIEDLADKYNIMQSAMASSERVFLLLDEPEQRPYVPPRAALPPRCGAVEFRNVSFSYNGTDWVLRNISFSIAAGEKIAIVGATGAGKTSIINLLNRLYEPTAGQILIDGVDICRLPLHELRRRIGVVLQEAFIFTGSVRENLSFGGEMSDEQLEQTAGRVGADRFINALPRRYDHPLNERGGNLSTGQKQLLSFARALAYNPDILVLDEATSSVDTETELLIRRAVHHLMENRTSIIIAHRISTIQHVDRIIVLHKGEIREMGGHRELLARKGIYYRLFQLQFEELPTPPADISLWADSSR